MIRKLYPQGKKKAFNVTYDDGVLQDVPFVELLNQYQIKGTFNLNSGLMENAFAWTHGSGLVVQRLSAEVAAGLYIGHEIASHTMNHPYMAGLSREEILREMGEDKAKLQKLFGCEIKGFAVPFDYYSDLIADCAKACGFVYARISEESGAFTPQKDFYYWRATVFHCCDGLEDILVQFLQTQEQLAVFQIVGHSYDLDVENRWEAMEGIFRAIRGETDILPMTNLEIVEYLQAMEAAEITESHIYNHSDRSLWFSVEGNTREVRPGEKLPLHAGADTNAKDHLLNGGAS